MNAVYGVFMSMLLLIFATCGYFFGKIQGDDKGYQRGRIDGRSEGSRDMLFSIYHLYEEWDTDDKKVYDYKDDVFEFIKEHLNGNK